MTEEQKVIIKEFNDKIIESKKYRFNSWLPILENPNVRSIEEVRARMSIMNALINISFEAPISIVRKWIDKKGMNAHLSN